jgi:hypothetical protein
MREARNTGDVNLADKVMEKGPSQKTILKNNTSKNFTEDLPGLMLEKSVEK